MAAARSGIAAAVMAIAARDGVAAAVMAAAMPMRQRRRAKAA